LHKTVLAEGCSRELIATLLEARADVNEGFFPVHPALRLFMKIQSAKHWLRPTALTRLAYHHKGSSPLMIGLLNNQFGPVSFLMEAGLAG
jgi:hypothetical protein